MKDYAFKKPPPRTGVIRDFDSKSVSVKVGLVVIYFLCALIALVSLFPVVWAFLAGFKDLEEFMSSTSFTPQTIDFGVYAHTWSQLKIYNNYLNSFYHVAGSVVCALIFNGLLAYGLAILKPKGYKIASSLVMLSLLMPATISLVPLFINIQHLHLGGFFTPLWLAAGANAFYVVLFRQFFESFPSSIIEASRIDGCSSLKTFSRIVLPLSKPICVVVAIYAINGAWSDFLLPYLILGQSDWETVMVRLYTFSTQQTVNSDDLMRAVVFAMIPPIILFFVFQKKLTENVVVSGIKG
ncbi:MAG: carbohydrate ABC transporter permease [Oscillospiraceae bacterium]|nr:carbohydrate ABC transporter permease [Oscillospiraceae bacterium]